MLPEMFEKIHKMGGLPTGLKIAYENYDLVKKFPRFTNFTKTF
jgi:hypothetical protein